MMGAAMRVGRIFEGGTFPSNAARPRAAAAELDAVAPDHPVWLRYSPDQMRVVARTQAGLPAL